MLSKEELIVLRHYVKEGLTKTAIAKTLGINRRTVHRNLSNGKDEPGYGPRPKRPSKLDHYKVYLLGRIEQCFYVAKPTGPGGLRDLQNPLRRRLCPVGSDVWVQGPLGPIRVPPRPTDPAKRAAPSLSCLWRCSQNGALRPHAHRGGRVGTRGSGGVQRQDAPVRCIK